MIRLLRAAAYPAMPWKNGGGETREIALSPPGAPLGDFDWRVSIARVDGDGPFSAFPGIDRTLTVLDGAMTLHAANGAVNSLDAETPPFAFDGGIPINAVVERGPVIDLNVMTRRARHRHSVRRETVRGERRLAATAPVTLLVALDEGLSFEGSPLLPRDCLMLAPGDAAVLSASTAEAPALLIEIADAG